MIILAFLDVSVGKNEHLKFVEALSKEEQQELTKLIDKNEDLFKENNKLKSENSGFKADKEKIITRTSELERKVIEMKVSLSF